MNRLGQNLPGRGDIFLDRSIAEVLTAKFRPYSFQVGILKNGPHYAAARGKPLKSYAGGPARRQTRKPDGTLASVSKDVREHLRFNYLTRPFQTATQERTKFVYAFFNLVFKDGGIAISKKRCENLLQAIVRNPILSGKYGRNRRQWARVKGFNRKLIDTAQFFKAITAKVRISVSR